MDVLCTLLYTRTLREMMSGRSERDDETDRSLLWTAARNKHPGFEQKRRAVWRTLVSHTVVSLSTWIYSTDWPLCQEETVDPGSSSISSVATRLVPMSPAISFFLPRRRRLRFVRTRCTMPNTSNISRAAATAARQLRAVYIPPGNILKNLLPTPQ